MARRKNAMALFEIISKHRDKRTEPKVAIPKWMMRRDPDEPVDETPPQHTAPEADVQEPPAEPTEQEAPAPREQREAQEAPQPQPIVDAELVPRDQDAQAEGGSKILVIEDGQVNVSLNYVGAGVAVTGVVVLLLGAFLTGRYSAPGGHTAAVGPPVGPPPGKKVTPPKGPGKGTHVAKKPPAAVPQKGKFYLVIQHLTGSEQLVRADGNKIIKFCTDNGYPAKTMRQKRPNGQYMYMVWSLKPFKSLTDPAATLHAEKIDELGKQYFRLHGKYRLTQREGGKIKLWLMKY